MYKKFNSILDPCNFQTVSGATGTSNGQDSWDERVLSESIVIVSHFFFLVSLFIYFVENVFFFPAMDKNSMKSHDFLATHREKQVLR
jgi:hypothetical protein